MLMWETMIKTWIHNREWLDSLKSDGISLIMHCFLNFLDGRNAPCLSAPKAQKINYYLDHVPVQVQIHDPHGNFYMDIKRCWKYSELMAKIAHRRWVGGNFSNASSPYIDNLQQCFGPLVNGSTIHLNMRIPSAPPSAEDCPGSFQIFVRGFGTSGTLYVLPEDTVETLRIRLMNVRVVKRFIDENIADFLPANFWIMLEGSPVTGGTVSENSICQNCTLHVFHRVRGGARKGVLKVKKEEKLHIQRARVHYSTSHLPATAPANLAADIAHVSQATYIPNAVAMMNLDQVSALDDAIQQSNRSNQAVAAAGPLLVPALAQLKQQLETITVSIKALEEAVELSFIENYYEGSNLLLDPFYNMVADRRRLVEQQAAMAVEVQRQLALHVPPPAANDGMDM